MLPDRAAIEESIRNAGQALADLRTSAGRWEDPPPVPRGVAARPRVRDRIGAFFGASAATPSFAAVEGLAATSKAVAALLEYGPAGWDAPLFEIAAPPIDSECLRDFLFEALTGPALRPESIAEALVALHVLGHERSVRRPAPASDADTAEPLRALRRAYDSDAPVRAAALHAVQRLVASQGAEGSFGSVAATAVVMRSLRGSVADAPEPLKSHLHAALLKAVGFLVRAQEVTGAWVGSEDGPDSPDVTAAVLRSAAFTVPMKDGLPLDWPQALWRGVRRLLDVQRDDGTWGDGEGVLLASGLATGALAYVAVHDAAVRASINTDRDDHWVVFHKMDEVLIDGERDAARVAAAIEAGASWLVEATGRCTRFGARSNGERVELISATLDALRNVAAFARA